MINPHSQLKTIFKHVRVEIHKFYIKNIEITSWKCARTSFTHELCSIRKRTSERSERVSFLIRINE